jgi:hypothetical protein
LVKAESLYYDGVLNLGQFNWFHGVLSVEQASKLLKGCQKGTFVVRVSKKTSKYVIVWVSDTDGLAGAHSDRLGRRRPDPSGTRSTRRRAPSSIAMCPQ